MIPPNQPQFFKNDEKTIQISNNRKIVVSCGYFLGDEFIDIRVWGRFPTEDIYKPYKKKGIFIRKSVFKNEIMPFLKELFAKDENL